MRIVFVGCGFLGKAAADLFNSPDNRILAITKAPDCEKINTAPHPPQIFTTCRCDITAPFAPLEYWTSPDLLIFCPGTRGGDASAYRSLYLDGFRKTLDAYHPLHTIFISSTSVYGDHHGAWVDEDTSPRPLDKRGEILLAAESLACTVLRLAGIYSAERSAYLRRYLDGSARIFHQRWVNQIHRDDAARAIFFAAEKKLQGLFNVCDEHPLTQHDIYAILAKKFGKPLPPCDKEIPKRPPANKRISCAKLRSLGWSPKFPVYTP